jgi:hypothetical protein
VRAGTLTTSERPPTSVTRAGGSPFAAPHPSASSADEQDSGDLLPEALRLRGPGAPPRARWALGLAFALGVSATGVGLLTGNWCLLGAAGAVFAVLCLPYTLSGTHIFRWPDADELVSASRSRSAAERLAAEADEPARALFLMCAARVALAAGDLEGADRLGRAILRSGWGAILPDLDWQPKDVVAMILVLRGSLAEARDVFEQARAGARPHQRPFLYGTDVVICLLRADPAGARRAMADRLDEMRAYPPDGEGHTAVDGVRAALTAWILLVEGAPAPLVDTELVRATPAALRLWAIAAPELSALADRAEALQAHPGPA